MTIGLRAQALQRRLAKPEVLSLSEKLLAQEKAKHIQLHHVPTTATPADVRRAITRAGVQGVVDVAIDYDRFWPSGRALLSLNDTRFLRDNLRNLERLTIAGIPVKAEAKYITEAGPSRMRGTKGREEATGRGIVPGNGPHGGITNCSTHVVIKGLPGRITFGAIAHALRNYRLARLKDAQNIMKVLPSDSFTMYSRFLIKLESEAEAHRLVRDLHETYLDEERNGQRFKIQARVVY